MSPQFIPAGILMITGSTMARARDGMERWARAHIARAAARKQPLGIMLNLSSGLNGIAGWSFDTLGATHDIWGYGPDGMVRRHLPRERLWTLVGTWLSDQTPAAAVSPSQRIDSIMLSYVAHTDPSATVLMLRDGQEGDISRAGMVYVVQQASGYNNRKACGLRMATHTFA